MYEGDDGQVWPKMHKALTVNGVCHLVGAHQGALHTMAWPAYVEGVMGS